MQSEHVSDPAEPGLLSAKRGGSTLFQVDFIKYSTIFLGMI